MKAIQEKLRRAVCSILALAMTLSLFSVPGLSGAALAAPGNSSSSQNAALTGETGIMPLASVDASGTPVKPTLYIDFLGDNAPGYTGAYLGADGASTAVPSDKDQSFEQKDAAGNANGPWMKYGDTSGNSAQCTPTKPGTVFWVGVGIDKMTLFELSKEGRGLTGVELGFYYNSEFVAPYTGSNDAAAPYAPGKPGDYKTVLSAENLSAAPNSLNQWNSNAYEIVEAIPERDVVLDLYDPTQETLFKTPTNLDITSGSDWKMLYVSLEKKDSDWNGSSWNTNNRFMSIPANETKETHYVMMLPFVLKKYDPDQDICFRLSRNASAFSMGGGRNGADNYDSVNNSDHSFGAWERETRTPSHNLKEMFNFEGDLNIFTGFNVSDQYYNAFLETTGQSTDPANLAKIYPSSDPSTSVSISGDYLSGLRFGDSVTLEVAEGAGVTVGITITRNSTPTGSTLTYQEVTPGSKYTFTMPDDDVTVNVRFQKEAIGRKDYRVELIKVDPNAVPLSKNTAKIEGTDSTGVSHFSDVNHGIISVAPDNTVTVDVAAHPDYKAIVSVKTKAGEELIVAPPDASNPQYRFKMPSADVEVTVTYEMEPRHYAELSVDTVADVDSGNTAKLSYTEYDAAGDPITPNPSKTLNGHDGGREELGPIPAGRDVRLDIHQLADYMVSEIRLYNGDDSGRYETVYTDLLTTPGLTWTDSANAYLTFTMPNNRVQVHVVFAARRNYTAKLFLQNGENAEMWAYKDAVEGSTGTPAPVRDETHMTYSLKDNDVQVWPGNKVRVDLDPKSSYVVESVTITWGSSNKITYPAAGSTSIPNPVEFVMPAADVNVFVKFKERPSYNVTLVYQDELGGTGSPGAYNSAVSGWPVDTTASPVVFDRPTKYKRNQGDHSTAWVQVRPGWYVASVWAEGWDSSPGGTNTGSGRGYGVVSVSGNGYNNGAGGRVAIEVEQPDEDLTVHVVLKEGVPPVEPEYTLKLQVDDPENTTAPLANNWAQVTVNSAGPKPVPAVSLANSNNNYLMPSAAYPDAITAGQLVEVTFQADTGYTVAGVSVTPSGLGIVPQWVGSNKVQFNMPAGATVVTVHFEKKDPTDPPPYTATLHITGTPTASEWARLLNTVSALDTMADGGTVSAWPGDSFKTDAQADPGRFVTVEVYQGGSTVAWTADNPGSYDGKGSFIMPAGNVDVYMDFGAAAPSADQNRLTLTAYGPVGTAVGQAGTVDLSVGGVAKGTAQSNETPVPTVKELVGENETVLLTIKPKSGYVVDRIVYTPPGTVSPAELAAPAGANSRAVQFAMPGSSAGVEVYFRKKGAGQTTDPGPTEHTANIVLRMEDDPGAVVNTAVVGDAQFDNLVPGGGYSKVAATGTELDIEALARNGYYISKIEITPKALGAGQEITGVFASQDMDFIMPDADCTVNVYFRKGWPDEAELWTTLRVHGPTGVPNNKAQLFNTTQATSAPAPITAGGTQSLKSLVGQEMRVKINAETGYVPAYPISVKDAAGTTVPYWWSGADEISFRMPNSWTVVDVTFEKEDPAAPVDLKATLYNKTTSATGVLTRTSDLLTTGNVVAGASGQITTLKPGDSIQLTASTLPSGKVPVVVVRTVSGVTVPVPAWTVTAGVYTTSFSMQDEDVEVYLTEADEPGTDEYLATLVVNEYGTTTFNPANQASMTVDVAVKTVAAIGAEALPAAPEETVTVRVVNTAPGYRVRSVEVRGASGALLALAQPNGDTYTYTMPWEDATAVVTFEQYDPTETLTAQVVVDNAGGTGNNAVIRKMPSTAAGTAKLTGLQPKDQIEVCITVQAGYRVQLMRARASDGQVVSITPPLLTSPETSQNVSFYMPSDNVVVFVRFTANSEMYQITMDVVDHTSPTPNTRNTAALHTGYSGWSAYINDSATPVTARGAVNDLVKVETRPQSGYYAVVYAVSDDVNVIPVSDLTLDYLVDPSGKTFTFSVPSNNVKVTVNYYPNTTPKPEHKVRLHITGVGGLAGKALRDYCILPDTAVWQVNDTTNTTNAPTVMEIPMKYLEKVAVRAKAESGYYLQSAYAKAGSTLLSADPGTTTYTPGSTVPYTGKTFQFTMQNSDVDVYMIFTDQTPVGPYTANLTVTGPADTDWLGNPVYGAAGSAVLTNTSAAPNVSTNTVLSNQAFNPATDSVTAESGHTLKVVVSVNPGYSIDRVVVTPLGLSVTPTSVTTDTTTGIKTYTYLMPADDIDINVRLKSDDIGRYKVTLHLKDAYLTDNPGVTTSVNSAKVSYTTYELTTDGASMSVPDTQYVCVETKPGTGYYVYRAYAITKNGAVLPLVDKGAPAQIIPLRHPHDRPPDDNHKAWFKMPAEAVDVYIDFKDITKDPPPEGSLSAVLTVLDDDTTHASKATMTLERGTLSWSVHDDSNPGSSEPINVKALENVKVTLSLAPGWTLDSITVTGGLTADAPVTQNVSNPNEYTFTMPAHDVGVVVKLKSTTVDGYKATLHVVDHSSATGNQVVMKDTTGGSSVNESSAVKVISKLKGNETIETTVTPKPGVLVRGVIATDGTGSHILSEASAGKYNYKMNDHDVDITVVFDNDDPDAPDMFLAIVEKTGVGASNVSNTAAIANTSNPALPSGMIWTGIYGEDPMQRLRVDVATAPGYSAVITARTVSGTVLPVLQIGMVGTVIGYLDVPGNIGENIIVTVEYLDSQPAVQKGLRLRIVDPNSNALNTAEIVEKSTTKLSVNGASTSDGPAPVAVGETLTLKTGIDSGYLQKAEVIVGGMSMTLTVRNNEASFRMPNADAEVVVTLADGVQTPRPHDNLHHDGFPGGASNPLYIDGYLSGDNLGNNEARIRVPNLYRKDLTPSTTVPAFEDPGKKYEYKLYLKKGENYVQLVPGVDYDVTSASSYDPGAGNAIVGAADPNTGWDFQLRSLKGESALSELLLNGGLLYITATDVTDPTAPLGESEYVEVVLGPSTKRGKFSATLKIVDSSGVTGNAASMTIGTKTVTADGDQILNLQGDELIRTQAKAATGARISAVTVTDKGGTRLLTEVPPNVDPKRFPYYMTGEDVTVTVYFEAKEDPLNPDSTHYIAAVSKRGEISVPGNDASIQNDSRGDLLKGAIWAEGNENNAMRVTVTVAKDYYATVTAYRKDKNTPVSVVVFGAGPGVTSFDALFTMPAADVQVVVTFTKGKPDHLESGLTLKLAGIYGTAPANAAKMRRKGSSVYELEVDADVTTIAVGTSATSSNVPAGTSFDLTTTHATGYSIEKVVVTVTTTPATLPFTLTLDSAGAYQNFAMPLGETVVEVYYRDLSQDPLTPRPYDPLHSKTYNAANYPVANTNPDLSSPTQEGWILATGMTPDSNGKKRIEVLVPTLHDDNAADPTAVTALENANIIADGAVSTNEYRFYWYDGFNYKELVKGTDISVTGVAETGAYTASDGTPFDGYKMTLTALKAGSILEYYINRGGRIYVTANKNLSATPSQESDYTQVIIPESYKATLHHKLVDGTAVVSGTGAKMEAWSQSTTTDNDSLSGTNGAEVVKISQIQTPAGYVLDGVVATTVAGTVNVLEGSTTGQYEYTMENKDVDVYVVYKKTDDPLKEKGPWIATVIKKNDGGLTTNSATIKDLDVTIPNYQKGSIWTAAYEGNVVRVDVTTANGWYAVITAETAKSKTPVKVTQFATGAQSFYGLFYMANEHVNVTVEYKKGDLPDYDLTLRAAAAGGNSGNSATLTGTGVSMSVNGTSVSDGPDPVVANTSLDLATASALSHSVKGAQMEVDGNGILIDIPLVDGKSLPDPVMPMGGTVVTVTFQTGTQAARPYDPIHSKAYNSAGYPVAGTNPDQSETGMEGWILAERRGGNNFRIHVPTLHNNKGTDPRGTLYHAGDKANANQPAYTLYWKDNMGVFQKLEEGVGKDITVTAKKVEGVYTDSGNSYDGYTLDVTVNLLKPAGDPNPTVGSFWGGYKLQEYLKSGGSIYITATNGDSGTLESEKTEVVFSRTDKYTATLHHKLVDNTGTAPVTVTTAATMSEGTTNVTADGGQIVGLDGNEDIRVHSISVDTGYHVVGVVATTDVGSKNVVLSNPGEYTYTMENRNVDLYVVYEKDDDPLRLKGPWIATVIKENDGGLAGNSAEIKDLDVTIPDHQKGDIWTAAYEGNVVRVDVTTEPGWYAVITAGTAAANTSVPVATFATGAQSYYGLFYMVNEHVNVTVKYVKLDPGEDLPSYELTLTKADAAGVTGNRAELTATGVGSGSAFVDGAILTTRVPNAATKVPMGTELSLTTTAVTTPAPYYVSSAQMKIDGFPTYIDIPLIDNVSLPKFSMPMGNAEVIVTYAPGDQTARPYDPDHSKAYNSANYPKPGVNPDLSSTGMEGWILAEKTAGDTTGTKFSIHVPTLHDNTGTDTRGTLYHAGDKTNANQPTYKLYWKDEAGVFHELKDGTTEDVTITAKRVEGVYTDTVGSKSFDGYTLDVTINLPNPPTDPNKNTVGTFWGGYKLQEYLKHGGSIYITATNGASGSTESEKTEVVFKSEDFKATLHIVNHSSHPEPGTVSMTDGSSTVTGDGKSFNTSGSATIKTTVKPDAGVAIRGVIATNTNGSSTLIGTSVTGGYEYSHSMKEQDADITVVFDNDPDPDVPEMYLAIVTKTGAGLTLSGNSAAIINTANPALPKGDIWTGIYGETPKQRLQLDVTTESGYYALITAKTESGVSVPVLQLGVEGTVMGYLDVPGNISENILITVDYQTTQPSTNYDLSLELVDPNNDASNTAEINTASILRVDGTSLTAGPEPVKVGTALNLTTSIATGSLVKAEITANGITTILTTNIGTTGFAMPNGDARVVVTLLKADKRTPRPHDNLQDPGLGGANGTAYINGYLKGQNQSDNKALIQVPNLFNKDLTPNTTIPAFDEPDKMYDYKLYLKSGGSYVELEKGVDYDITRDASYDPGSSNATTGVHTHSDTGWEFQIRSLKGESALTELLLDGGVLYITATDVTDPANPLAESEYVEVVLPADPNKPDPSDPTKGYKATLWVVDNSDVSGNTAGMFIDGHTPLSYTGAGANVDASQGDITGLRGDEIVRTTAKAAAGARISAVTVTDAGGTRLLPEVPDKTLRFPYYMTGENVVITVYFEKDDPTDPDDTRFIAAVAKYGAIAVSGNEAKITNTTHTGLGTENATATPHWAEGYEKDKMQVSIGLAAGYYAEVEAFHKPSGAPVALKQTIFGPGPYAISADTLVFTIDMPASDVQVNVTFVKELSAGLRPYDPNNTGSSVYDDHWITSENQGDRLVVVVPELNQKDGSSDTDVDKTKHSFHFYMKVDSKAPESLENVITLSHPDPTDTSGDPYENGIYYPDPATPAGTKPTKYHGARFILTVKTDKEIDKVIDDQVTAGSVTAADAVGKKARAKELAILLRAIMDNAGTKKSIGSGVDVDLNKSGTTKNYKCRLYITHTDSSDSSFESDQVDFEVPQYYSLAGELESYAPAHIAQLSLELYDAAKNVYRAPTYDYESDVPYHMVVELSEKVGNGLWKQEFAFKSSKLAEKQYQFVAKKAAHVTYKRPEVILKTAAAPAGCYDAATLTFSFDDDGDPIQLICGDIDGNQKVKFRDWDYLLMYMYGQAKWTTTVDKKSADWALSVYNPESGAYAADLTGDGRINARDEMVLMDERNYDRSSVDYNNPTGLKLNAAVAPVALFSMRKMAMRMSPRMAMFSAGPEEAVEGQDEAELSIPEWAAELVRSGVRVPMWAVELIRMQISMPEWGIQVILAEREMPDWALVLLMLGEPMPDWSMELLMAGEALPDWALELISRGESLPAEPMEPGAIPPLKPLEPEKTRDPYAITPDVEIKPIEDPKKDEDNHRPSVSPGGEPGKGQDAYSITSDTDIKDIEPSEETEDVAERAEEIGGAQVPTGSGQSEASGEKPDDKDSQEGSRANETFEEEKSNVTEPLEEEGSEPPPQEDGDELFQMAEDQGPEAEL